ncbi:Phosphoglycerate kinase [Gossypium australe]|uniref:Phosphoglycerate kinase n=1 Tax=Gossypium australe TaxID=47621 RepID=A0A5B6WXI8_9ROSI|nr:Phosphoglycerate kinase [Gossypium australe]
MVASSPLLDGHSLEYRPTVLESPFISKTLSPIEIPNLVACNPACASAANGDAIPQWRIDLDAKISPPTSRTTSPTQI